MLAGNECVLFKWESKAREVVKGQNLVRGLGKETPRRDLGLTQRLLVLLSFEPSTVSGHLSRKDSNERQRNQRHIGRGVHFWWAHRCSDYRQSMLF